MSGHRLHAVSVIPGELQTVCGRALDSGVVCTGWGRAQQDVCPGVDCPDCLAGMEIARPTPRSTR